MRCGGILRAELPDMFAKWRFDRALVALKKSEHPVLRNYADADWPDRGGSIEDTRFLALDFELDGLRKDAHLLQAGWVPFSGRSISLAQAHSVDIRSSATLDDTAVTIHGIGEQRAAKGAPIAQVLHELIAALAGRVLVAHAASIEVTALRRATKAIYGTDLPIRSVCTLMLEKHLHHSLVGQQAYRLGPARSRYGLPEYRAHDALTDAIASAELFQAQISRLPSETALSRVEQT